jgi:hypothetical protein
MISIMTLQYEVADFVPGGESMRGPSGKGEHNGVHASTL